MKKKESKKIKIDDIDKKMKKPRKKRHILLSLFLLMMIGLSLSVLSFCVYIMVNAPEFDVTKLASSNTTRIFDADGNEIAELGTERRENITYDQLPDVLIDAIVATEDSKFFQHGGVDLLRFGKAVLGHLMHQSGAGGASTITMQLNKKKYTSDDESIIRKFTDIYMAVFKIEKTYTKQEILEYYTNYVLLGGANYGVEQAAQSYFGKSASELNLSEAAVIAGLIQNPNGYHPYSNTEACEKRRNTVLNLMVRHGYITEEEASIAKSISVKDLLKKEETTSEEKKTNFYEYQDFIDTVISEVRKRTNNDPYTVSMNIYTTMRKDKQDVVNRLYSGELYKWKNDVVQAGLVITDVSDGSVVAIGSHRNRTGSMQFNYATFEGGNKRHPGSTAKPILDYGPAIEYNGWGSGTTIIDDVYTYSNGTPVHNYNRSLYLGITTIKNALANSQNIPALQAFQSTTQEQKKKFAEALGITLEIKNGEILESSALGAFNGVNPLELSAAYGTFARGGEYIEPYTWTKIVYNDTGESIDIDNYIERHRAMSEETAFIINMMLKYAVTNGNIGAGSVSGTDLASKTGTSSVDETAAHNAGIYNSDIIGDSWQVAYSPDYAMALWYGYPVQLDKEHYLTMSEGSTARKTIISTLTPRIMKQNSRWKQPKGITTVTIEKETSPVMLASVYTPDNLRSTEYFKKGTEPTEVSPRFSRLGDVTNLTYEDLGDSKALLSWSPVSIPEAMDLDYLKSYFYNKESVFARYKTWPEKYLQRRISYNNSNYGNVQYEIIHTNSDGSYSNVGMTSDTRYTVTLPTSVYNTNYTVRSRYALTESYSSSGVTVNVKVKEPIPKELDPIENITNNDTDKPDSNTPSEEKKEETKAEDNTKTEE